MPKYAIYAVLILLVGIFFIPIWLEAKENLEAEFFIKSSPEVNLESMKLELLATSSVRTQFQNFFDNFSEFFGQFSVAEKITKEGTSLEKMTQLDVSKALELMKFMLEIFQDFIKLINKFLQVITKFK